MNAAIIYNQQERNIMEKKYTYDAFISYRHTELDKFVAENLHKAMETFKLPKNIQKKGNSPRTRIERVFRDRDELPLASNLEDPIVAALKESEYLIVICSPRLKESMWCKKEIETFIELHGREKILAVLVEGEPEESFPEELLSKTEEVKNPDGTTSVVKKNLEPLAADVRGTNKKEVMKALKSELLRLLAPMFCVSYDDLRQRHRERKMKQIIAASVTASLICLCIGFGSTVAAIQIKKQKEQIEKQAGEISAQAEKIKAQNDEITAQNDKLLTGQAKSLAEKSLELLEKGDRIGALKTAGQAVREYDGIAMPYTPEAKYALTESLHIYDSNNVNKAEHQMSAFGIIDFISVSPDRKTVVALDDTDRLFIWEIATGKLLDTISDVDRIRDEDDLAFIGNDRFAYPDNEGRLCIYSIAEKKIVKTIEVDEIAAVSSDKSGKYLAVTGWSQYQIFDTSTLTPLFTYRLEKRQGSIGMCYFNDNDIMVYTENLHPENFEIKNKKHKKEETRLTFVNLSDGSAYASATVNYSDVSDIVFDDKKAYVTTGNPGDIMYGLQNVKYAVNAFKLEDGSHVWEYTAEGNTISGIEVPTVEKASNLMIYIYGTIYLLDKDSGQEKVFHTIGSNIAESATFKESGDFLVFTQSGKLLIVSQNGSEPLSLNRIFECKSQDVKCFKPAENGFLVVPSFDNKITLYSASCNPEIKAYEGNAIKYDSGNEINAAEESEKLGLEKAALATNVVYSSEKDTVFISYSDNTLEIYKTDGMVLLETVNNLKCKITKYIGNDKEGNIYVAGLNYGYCFDKNYKLTAKIENLLGIDSENNLLIVEGEESVSTIPIYTTEELLKKLSEDIDRYENQTAD